MSRTAKIAGWISGLLVFAASSGLDGTISIRYILALVAAASIAGAIAYRSARRSR